MKTMGLGKLLLITAISFSFYSCKEEEFYEKEFIDTLSDQYERENNPPQTEDPGDNGGGDNGGGDNGGGDNGGGDNGGGDNGGGDNGGGDDEDPVTPPTPVVDVEDSFQQESTGVKLDILWVIDNSGSMGDEQRKLGENFDAFIREFTKKGLDFQMAVTTTDTQGNNSGKAYKDSMQKLTSEKLQQNESQFLNDFESLVKVGTRGHYREKGLKASEDFANRYGQSWIREDAYLTVVYMSDEQDQSPKAVEDHLKQIQKWKNNNGYIKTYGIVNTSRASTFSRYEDMINLTNGKLADIKSDFYSTLLQMGEQIAQLTEQFPLSSTPYDLNSITVTVNDVIVSDWQYISETNSIKFDENHVPQSESVIKVSYQKEE